MMSRYFRVFFVYLMVWTVFISGCQTNRGSDAPKVLGAVDIRDEQMIGQWPAGLPRTVYISDFALGAQRVEGDHGMKDVLPGGRTGQIGKRLPHPLTDSNPEAQAGKIIDAMSQSLIRKLSEKGLVAQRLPRPLEALPHEGWLIQGVFTEVDEGNRIKRAVIEFGRGATSMEVQVAVSDLASAQPKTPFIVFGTVKTPKKMPGAVVTMNPYVAAAKFVIEKNATEKDIEKTAEQIVGEILKHTHEFKEQAESKAPKRHQ